MILFLILLLFAHTSCSDVTKVKQLDRQGADVNANDSYYVKGALVVGFEKGVSRARAEKIVKNYSIKYERTHLVNMGRKFHDKTGEKFLVMVPEGEEQIWLEKFKKMQEVKAAGLYPDPEKILLD